MQHRIARAFGLVLFAGTAMSAAVSNAVAQSDDPVVAIVDGSSIHRSEIANAQRGLPEQYRALPLELIFPVLVDRVIDAKLLALEGRKADLQDDAEVRERVAEVEDLIIRDIFVQRHLDAVVTEKAVRESFDKMLKERPGEEEVRARHILLETEEQAKEVITALNDGADFADLAKEKSKGPSAERGGDLDYFKKDEMVGEFSEAAFALKTGETTEAPVQTQFGWHVIKVEDRRQAEPPTFEEASQDLAAELARSAMETLVAGLRESAEIQRFNVDGSPIEAKSEDEGKSGEAKPAE